MSKKSKARGKDKRLKEKRARKAAQAAKYQRYAELGQNQKSKRSRNRKAIAKVSTVSHPNGRCGNPGCEKCFGITFSKLFFENKKPKDMPQRMYLAWREAA